MITRIDIPIYNTSVAVLTEITEKEFKDFYKDNKKLLTRKEYKNLYEDIFINKYPGITLYTDSHNVVLYLRNGKSDNNVSHEIFHVCNLILWNRDVSFSKQAEAWAYLIGWFTEEYYRKYWEYCEYCDNVKNKTK